MKSEDEILSIGCGSCIYEEGKYQCYDGQLPPTKVGGLSGNRQQKS